MRGHYQFLDLLRGLAALAVVGLHLAVVSPAPLLFPHAYLAVDFFFMLSGFVLSAAYEEKAKAGLSLKDFALIRMMRLFPLSIAGVIIGSSFLIYRGLIEPSVAPELGHLSLAGLLNAMMIPAPKVGDQPWLLPTDAALWSLFFECVVNLVWWVFLARRQTRTIACVMLACGLAFCLFAVSKGTTDIGFLLTPFHLVAGFVRAMFGFSIGVLIYRMKPKPFASAPVWMPLALCAAFVALTVGGSRADGPAPYDLFACVICLPALLYGAVLMPCATGGRFSRFMGALSYPLYVLHYPCVLMTGTIVAAWGFEARWSLYLIYVPLIGLATVMDRHYDRPMRERLSALLKRERIPPRYDLAKGTSSS